MKCCGFVMEVANLALSLLSVARHSSPKCEVVILSALSSNHFGFEACPLVADSISTTQSSVIEDTLHVARKR